MTTTNIILSTETTIAATGEHINGNSKAMGCVETGQTWPSVKDCAKEEDVLPQNMSRALSKNKNGEYITYKGKRYFFMSDGVAVIPTLLDQIKSTQNDAEDARKWREYQAKLEAERKAEQERIEAERKAKEKLDTEITKAKEVVARRKEIYERKLNEAKMADERLAKAEQKLYELLDKANGKEVA